MNDAEINRAFAAHILKKEARRDREGRLTVYDLDPEDGGGKFEVAGINERYHPDMAHQLRYLIEQGRYSLAEEKAEFYLLHYTHAVDEWHPDEAVEGHLRCIAFNRGAGGAAWILQYALRYGFTPALYKAGLDMIVGPKTRAGAAEAPADQLMLAIYGARIVYERTAISGVKGRRDEKSQFWHGLFRRFTDDVVFAVDIAQATQ